MLERATTGAEFGDWAPSMFNFAGTAFDAFAGTAKQQERAAKALAQAKMAELAIAQTELEQAEAEAGNKAQKFNGFSGIPMGTIALIGGGVLLAVLMLKK